MAIALVFCMNEANAAQLHTQQDARSQQIQIQTSPNISIRRSQIDLERGELVMRQFEQREQEMIIPQLRVAKQKPVEPIRKPSIEVDPLLSEYAHIGCTPRECFPDTFLLTVLERYYQEASPPAPLQRRGGTPLFFGEGLGEGLLEARYPSSITLFVLLGLFLLAYIKYNFGKNLSETFHSFFSYRQSQRMFEECRESDRHAAFLSNILFVLIAGIFISLALPFFDASPLWENYTLSILFFSLATGLLYFLKSMIWKTLGVIFLVQSFVRTYIYNMYLYNRNIGLMIFPFVALIPYMNETITPYIVYIIIAIFIFSYVLKLWRIFEIIHEQNVSIFYFILYLCTLEILPLLLLIKGCKVVIEFNLSL